VEAEPADVASERKLEFAPIRSDKKTYCVSYAWNDESKEVVDNLCEEARRRGIEILRDTNGLGLGESISRFMQRLGAGDHVFVILSEKYLKSPYCMYELLEVWRNSKMEGEVFRQRVRVYRLPDARILELTDRMEWALHWKKQFSRQDAMLREHGPDLLGQAGFRQYRLTQEFAHHVGDMLDLIADTLQPTDFEQLRKYGFTDDGPATGPALPSG
jgi:internalin A